MSSSLITIASYGWYDVTLEAIKKRCRRCIGAESAKQLAADNKIVAFVEMRLRRVTIVVREKYREEESADSGARTSGAHCLLLAAQTNPLLPL